MIDVYDNELILEKIKLLCKERGWKPYKLAKKADLPKSTIYSWFRTKSSPTLSVLNAVCEAFGISILTFLLDDEDYSGLTNEQITLIDSTRIYLYE